MGEIVSIKELLDGVEVEWNSLGEVFDILAGGDVPKKALSKQKTQEYNIPILSNGIDKKSLYGWTNKAKINKASLTISARGTIGWVSLQSKPFFPIVRLLVLTPKIEINLKYTYYYMKMIENNYNVSKNGIPQLTKPMIKNIEIPIPPLHIQSKIVQVLDNFTELTAELTARKKQYSYYRDKLLRFGDDVEFKPLGEVGELVRGNGLPKADFKESGIPAIHYGQIYTYYGTSTIETKSFVSPEIAKKLRKVNKGDVVITNTSENLEDVGKALSYLGELEAVTGGHATIFSYP